jgi:formylglycine-generating enzyme required for sulfatase activity
MKDYYAILEIAYTATPEEIKAQFRLLMQAWHPDKFGSPQQKAKAEAKAIEINEAYAILSNPAKRAEYDSLFPAADSGQTANAEAAPNQPPSPQQSAKRPPQHPQPKGPSQSWVSVDRLVLPDGEVMEFVRVPAGEFLMGSADSDHYAWSNCKPQHKVNLDEYLIGRYPVTNAQYFSYAVANRLRWSIPFGKANHPVVNVNWGDAMAFCQWASHVTGRQVRLPTEAQWEKAARGTDGRIYPWGDEPPDASRMNYDSRSRFEGSAMSGHHTTPVGQFSPYGDSIYGAADMLGNVDEWTVSPFRPYRHGSTDTFADSSAEVSKIRIVRGGNFISRIGFIGCARRGSQAIDCKWDYLGFRVMAFPARA